MKEKKLVLAGMNKSIQPMAPAPPAGDILTDAQVCALLMVEPRTLRLWRRTRGLPMKRIPLPSWSGNFGAVAHKLMLTTLN